MLQLGPERRVSLFPDGYRDPAWDGSEAGFAAVAEARAGAIAEHVSGMLPDGLSVVFGPVSET